MTASLAQKEDGTGRKDCRQEGPWRRAPSLGTVTQGGPREGSRPQAGSTHIQAGSGSSHREAQGALLFYGPEDLGEKVFKVKRPQAMTACNGAHDACSCT